MVSGSGELCTQWACRDLSIRVLPIKSFWNNTKIWRRRFVLCVALWIIQNCVENEPAGRLERGGVLCPSLYNTTIAMNPPSSHWFRHFIRRFTTSIIAIQWCAGGGFSFHIIYTSDIFLLLLLTICVLSLSFLSFPFYVYIYSIVYIIYIQYNVELVY